MDVQEGKALLLSENVLEQRKYHESKAVITWEISTLRSYLNNEFYNKFSNEEKTLIAETRVVNKANPWYGIDDDNDTMDKIFILSIEEVVKYFGDSGDLRNRKGWYFDWRNEKKYVLKPYYRSKEIDGEGYYINDNYNTNRIAKDLGGEACSWWLRSCGGNGSCSTAVVQDDGILSVLGGLADYRKGVRPALWLNLCNDWQNT